MKFVIWSAGYNCKDFVASNIASIASQTYKNFIHVVADDASNDGTQNIIEACSHDKLVYYRNEVNQGWIWNAVNYLDKHVTNNCIVVAVDLDDWLAHNRVLERLAEVYTNTGAWITYGSLIACYANNKYVWEPEYKYPDEVWHKRDFRLRNNYFSHLRTFRGFLWNKINKQDLYRHGVAPKFSSDVGYSLPILEMTPPHRVIHLDDPLYFYNSKNALNDDKKNPIAQRQDGNYYRSLRPYRMLEDDLEKHIGA